MKYFMLRVKAEIKKELKEFYVPYKTLWDIDCEPSKGVYELEIQSMLGDEFASMPFDIYIKDIKVVEEIPFEVYKSSRITLIEKEGDDIQVTLYKELLNEIREKANIADIGLERYANFNFHINIYANKIKL